MPCETECLDGRTLAFRPLEHTQEFFLAAVSGLLVIHYWKCSNKFLAFYTFPIVMHIVVSFSFSSASDLAQGLKHVIGLSLTIELFSVLVGFSLT